MNRHSLGLLVTVVYLVASLLASVGCNLTPAPAPTPSQAPTPPPTRAIPTPTSDAAVIHGTLLDFASNKPLPDQPVYLAEIIATGGSGGMMVASMEPTTAPRAYSDSAGRFIFAGVAPKSYALATVTPSGHVLFVRPDTRVEVTATVRAKETIDLGSVFFDPTAWK